MSEADKVDTLDTNDSNDSNDNEQQIADTEEVPKTDTDIIVKPFTKRFNAIEAKPEEATERQDTEK